MRIVVNLLILYAAWFGAVLAAAANRPLAAAAASLIAVGLNVALSNRRWAEIRLVLQAAIVGLLVDGLLINTGLASYASPGPIPQLPPLWLVAMWMAFATAINVSIAWLKRRLMLATVLGLLGGPVSYYAGARLGGMQFSEPLWVALFAVGVLWAIAFPVLLHLARRDDA